MSDNEPTDEEFFEIPEDTGFSEELESGRARTKDIDSIAANHQGDPIEIFSEESVVSKDEIEDYERALEKYEEDLKEWKEKEKKRKKSLPKKKPGNWLVYEPKPVEPEGPKPSKPPGRPKGSKNINLSPVQRAKLEAVTLMVSCGITHASISKLLGMSMSTLRSKYRKELSYGRDILTSRIANALIQKALDGNVMAQVFWLKARAGWKEPTQVELTGKNGGPIISGVEREQRLMSIMLQNPLLKQKMLERRSLKEAGVVDVTPSEVDNEIF